MTSVIADAQSAEERRKVIINRSVVAGFKAAAIGFVVSTAATGIFAARKYQFFQRMNASVKVAGIAMATLGAFGLKSEQQLIADRNVPNSVPLESPNVPPVVDRLVSSMSSPFRVLMLLGVPTVAVIGYRAFNSKIVESSGRTSMAVMHTRIVGQITVVAILIGLMLFSGNGPLDWDARRQREAKEK